MELLKTNIIGFTTPCFIRKNTPELRNKLEGLGYKYSTFDDLKLDGIITFPSKNDYSIFANYHFDNNYLNSYIDCGTNEELFLALAALRDDSDYMQWFMSPKTRPKISPGYCGQIVGMDGHYKEIVGYEWYRYENKDNALTEKLNAMVQMEAEDMEFEPHKATVEELIEHFKR